MMSLRPPPSSSRSSATTTVLRYPIELTPPRKSSSLLPRLAAALLLAVFVNNYAGVAEANPKSRPYVAYRTSPFDHGGDRGGGNGEFVVSSKRILEDGKERRGAGGGDIHKNEVNRRSPTSRKDEEDARCPLSFRLGSAHSAHFSGGASGGASSSSASDSATKRSTAAGTGVGTHTPPVIHPLHPDFDAGSGRQILLTTDYEVLEMWTPSSAIGTHRYDVRPASSEGEGDSKSRGGGGGMGGSAQSTEQMKEDEQFPLLFEGSSFYHTSPVVHDVEGDGIADAILGDYDGNLHLVGLDFEKAEEGHRRRRRYYQRLTVPRLHVRKSWYDYAINRTSEAEAMAKMNATTALDGINTTNENSTKKWEEFEPYHTYFAGTGDEAWRGKKDEEALRGVSGDVLNMDVDLARGLAERRRLQKMPEDEGSDEARKEEKGDEAVDGEGGGGVEVGARHRRLQEVVDEPDVDRTNEGNANDGNSELEGEGTPEQHLDDYKFEEEPGLYDDAIGAPPDSTEDTGAYPGWGDDFIPAEPQEGEEKKDGEGAALDVGSETSTDDESRGMYDDYSYGRYGHYGDDIYRQEAPEGWDSYEQYQEAQDKYFHDSNYLRLPPHLLSTCSLAELPRMYAGSSAKAEDRVDEMVLCAVSYYFDEDECRGSPAGSRKGSGKSFGKHANADGGDETEEQRGRYVANAVLGYNLRWKYWSMQEVLDLSTDWSAPLGDIVEGGMADVHSDAYSGMGAWALATPVAVKLDGGDRNHILVGTSMGLVYALEAQWHSSKSGWPVQMRHPVEQKVLVEDVVGNTNLEAFVVDAGGDVVSLDAGGEVLWARNLLRDGEAMMDAKGEDVRVVRGTSPMSMGDVEGTGGLAIVLLARITATDRQNISRPDKHVEVVEYRLYAIDAATGDDLPHFPISLGGGLNNLSPASSMPQPLLIDLHEDQHHWLDQMHGLSKEDVETIRTINTEASQSYHPSSKPRPHGGSGRGLHVVQPLGSTLHIVEGSTSCEQTVDVGDSVPSMVQADDVHGTGGLDLVVTTSRGEILTLESDVVPYHPLNVWSAGTTRAPGSGNAQAHGFSSSQGIFVHPVSRQFRDVLGIYIPITFEIFDRRPGIADEPNRREYDVEIRAGMSVKRTVFSHKYGAPGVYTERINIPFGPGYYAFSVRLRTTHGIVYEDTFHLGWNVNYMGGLWLIVFLPLVMAAIPILMFKRQPNWEEDEDYGSRGTGILGRAPLPAS